jgi:hypothetical protein
MCVFGDYTLALAAAAAVRLSVRCADAVAAARSVCTTHHSSSVLGVVLVFRSCDYYDDVVQALLCGRLHTAQDAAAFLDLLAEHTARKLAQYISNNTLANSGRTASLIRKTVITLENGIAIFQLIKPYALTFVERRQLCCLTHIKLCLQCTTPFDRTLTCLYCMSGLNILTYNISASRSAMYRGLLLLLLLLKLVPTLLTDKQLKAASSNISYRRVLLRRRARWLCCYDNI